MPSSGMFASFNNLLRKPPAWQVLVMDGTVKLKMKYANCSFCGGKVVEFCHAQRKNLFLSQKELH
jgi:hypothetical protein